MKVLNQSHCSITRARHPRRGAHRALIVSFGTLLGACSLDTAPESTPSRAALEADGDVEAESSTLDTPSQLSAGAAAPPPTPTQTAQPSAAIVTPPPEAENKQPENKQPENKEAAPAQAAAPKPEEKQAAPTTPKQAEPKDAAETRGCKPGDYEGVIAGTVNFGPLEVTTLTGKISLRLVADRNNENLLRVEQGRVEGIDLNKAVFIADITGQVDCATGELVQSEVERGMYEDNSELLKVGFTGTAEGHYSADPPSLLGTWNISDDSTLLAGQGTWTSTLAEALR